jgi:hypothetical protein
MEVLISIQKQKFVTKILEETLNLSDTYNVKNSVQLTNDLNHISVTECTRTCSLDTEDMYTNIPQQDVTHIIHNMLSEHNENTTNDTQHMLNILLKQNYSNLIINTIYKKQVQQWEHQHQQ